MADLHEKAEKLASTLERINDVCDAEAATLLRALSARLAEVEADLKSVLDREAATTARYDARVAAAYEEAARVVIDDDWDSGPGDLSDDIRALARPEETDALARIRAEAVEEAAQMFDDVHLDYEGAVVVSMLRARAAAIREDKT